MYQNYYSLELNTKHMNRINYLSEIKKITRYYLLKLIVFVKINVSIFLTHCLHYSLKIIKFILPYKLIKKLIPNLIKIKIKILLSKYPNFIKIMKYILIWIKEDKEIKSNYLILILNFLIKKFFITILRISLNSFEIQKIIYNELRKNTNFQAKLNQKINNKTPEVIDNYKFINTKAFISENFDLSLDTQEVYHKMQFNFIHYQI